MIREDLPGFPSCCACSPPVPATVLYRRGAAAIEVASPWKDWVFAPQRLTWALADGCRRTGTALRCAGCLRRQPRSAGWWHVCRTSAQPFPPVTKGRCHAAATLALQASLSCAPGFGCTHFSSEGRLDQLLAMRSASRWTSWTSAPLRLAASARSRNVRRRLPGNCGYQHVEARGRHLAAVWAEMAKLACLADRQAASSCSRSPL